MKKQLFKSRNNKVFSGVCGGIAEYFSMDPFIIRLAWVLVSLVLGAGIGGVIIYVIAAVIVPEKIIDDTGFSDSQSAGSSYDNNYYDSYGKWDDVTRYESGRGRLVIGGILVLLGLLALVKQYIHIDFKLLWPLVIVAIGAFLVYTGRGNRYE